MVGSVTFLPSPKLLTESCKELLPKQRVINVMSKNARTSILRTTFDVVELYVLRFGYLNGERALLSQITLTSDSWRL